MFLWCYSTAPPARYAVAAGLTAEEVRKGLGFGVHLLRLQKTASLLHSLSRIAEFCFRPLLRLRLGASVFFAVASLFEPCSRLESLRASRHPPPLNMYWVGWGGAQAFPRERITRVGLFARYPSLSSRQGYRLAVHTLAAESHALRSCSRLEPLGSRQPPGLPGQASELYYETIK